MIRVKCVTFKLFPYNTSFPNNLTNKILLLLHTETITYTEDALVSKKPKKEDEIKISDVATKVRSTNFMTTFCI